MKQTTLNVLSDMRQACKPNDLFNGEEVGEPLIRGMVVSAWADRLEDSLKKEHELLKSCARLILMHDVYGSMAKELLAECKEFLNDDGNFIAEDENNG